MTIDGDLHATMERSYLMAREDFGRHGYSSCWTKAFYDEFLSIIRDRTLWSDFMNNGITEGMGGPRYSGARKNHYEVDDPKERQYYLDVYAAVVKLASKSFVDEMLISDLGNPVGLIHDGKLLNIADLRHIYTTHQIRQNTTLDPQGHHVIVEIGGGYGGLAQKLHRSYPNAKIIVLDLLEPGAIQTYLLQASYPAERIFTYEQLKTDGIQAFLDGTSKFAVLPGEAVEMLPPASADLFINQRSMMEMDSATIASYFRALQKALRLGGYFYCVNRYHKADVGENIELKRYPFDDRWYISLSQPSLMQPHIHELLSVRTALPNAYPPERVLFNLMPYRLRDVMTDLRAAGEKLRGIILGRGVATGNPGMIATLLGRGEMAENPIRKLRRHIAQVVRRK